MVELVFELDHAVVEAPLPGQSQVQSQLRGEGSDVGTGLDWAQQLKQIDHTQ